MPRRSPFTTLFSRLAAPRLADLHVHTTASDGEYTAQQVVALARAAGLAAVAVTDHDTVSAVEEARASAPPGLEVVSGVEISTSFRGRELHLLAYFLDVRNEPLLAALRAVCDRRRDRFRDYLAKLADDGHPIAPDRAALVEQSTASLGRRHVAGLLAACGFAHTTNEAFGRFLRKLHGRVLPKVLIPVEEAVALVKAAGGATSLAHPPPEYAGDAFLALRDLGVDALETEYAWGRSSPAARLRATAAELGMLVTGGSDCHGPHPAHRRVGTHGVAVEQLARLRAVASARGAGG